MEDFSHSEIFQQQDSILSSLLWRSYAIVNLENLCCDREELFQEAFSLSDQVKQNAGEFRIIQKFSIGYKEEGDREFFDTRIRSDGSIEPELPINNYCKRVTRICQELNQIGVSVLQMIAYHFHLDPSFLLDLIDAELIPTNAFYSASVLRIASYPSSSSGSIAFGAHTDTSFLTIAPVSSNPCLEVYNYQSGNWRSVEAETSSPAVIVFVGEFLQVLFKQQFRACIHRVRCPTSGVRYSCPFIMRGRPGAVLDRLNIRYSHDRQEALAAVADLDAVSMEEVHTLLDMKRKKCARANVNSQGEWVLAAYPALIVSSERVEEVDSTEGGRSIAPEGNHPP